MDKKVNVLLNFYAEYRDYIICQIIEKINKDHETVGEYVLKNEEDFVLIDGNTINKFYYKYCLDEDNIPVLIIVNNKKDLDLRALLVDYWREFSVYDLKISNDVKPETENN